MANAGKGVRLGRRAVLAGLLAGAAGPALANPPLTSLRPLPRAADFQKRTVPPVAALIDKAKLGGKIGFAVADARTGEMLEVHAPLLPLPPASVTKSVTAIYALEALGPDYRFRTRLAATGPVENGVLQGDLVLVGGGDPTLDTDTLGDMARQLKAAGVGSVTGRFLVDAAALPTIWSIDEEQPDHLGYNPTISGLNLNFNRVYFQWKRGNNGYAVTLDARASKYRPEVAIAQMRVVERDMPVYTYSDAGGADQWTVARGALGQGGGRWLPVRKPELYAAEVFQTIARSYGVRLPKAEVAAVAAPRTVLVEHASDDLRSILRGMLKYSTNLTAEAVGLTATAARVGRPDSLVGSAAVMSDWMEDRLGARRPVFEDHSGLGDDSRITAVDMVKALVSVGPDGPLAPILKPIPMRNSKGDVIEGHPVKVQAKTGTLNFVSALSGYMRSGTGRDLAFAIFTADMDRRDAIPLSERDRAPGARSWNGRSRRLQLDLIERWGVLHSA